MVELGGTVFGKEFGGGIAVELVGEREWSFSVTAPDVGSTAGIKEEREEFRVIARGHQMHDSGVATAILRVDISAISKELLNGGNMRSTVHGQEHERSTALSITGMWIEHDVGNMPL